MRKFIHKIQSIPLIWHIIFVVIAFINLSAPLFLFSFQNDVETIEKLNEGIGAFDKPMNWDNGSLNAERETIVLDDQYKLSVLDGVPGTENFIHFSENNVSFKTTDLEFEIEYSDNINSQEDLFLEIISAAQSNLILQGAVNFIIALLFNGIIYLAILMGAKYFTKELYKELYKFLTIPFITIGITASVLSIALSDHYLVIYLTAILIIGVLTAINLKEVIDKRNTSYYLGNEEL